MEHLSSRFVKARGGRCVVRLAAAAAVIASGTTLAAGLNDTGQAACYNAAGATESCATAGQDGRYGRDAAATAGALTKTGAGAAAFDFTKIANNGTALAAGAALGPNPGDWACTRDNVTGLIWEIKTDSVVDLRYLLHAYTWYSTAANNGGDAGSLGGDSCNGTLAACNTLSYALAVNAATLCGHGDWRLPTIKELQSIKNFGGDDPAIDTNYFPNTDSSFYWAADSCAPAASFPAVDAWSENFTGGTSGTTSSTSIPKSAGIRIRLVRSGAGP